MTALRLELDHVGVGMRDLEQGRRSFERLGFTLTPRSQHSGAVTRGPVQPWGSGNHCAMFRRGYLEVVGIIDPGLCSSLTEFVQRYEGGQIVAIGVPEADLAYAELSRRAPGIQPPKRLQRDAAFGIDGRQTRLAAFSNIYADRDLYDEARFIFIEHLTRDVLWQPHLLEHANGAVGVTDAWLCVEDRAAAVAKYARLFGREARAAGDGADCFDLERGRVWLIDRSGLATLAPGVTPPCMPYVAAVGFAVQSIEVARYWLRGQGVEIESHGDSIRVAPRYACGAVVLFHQD